MCSSNYGRVRKRSNRVQTGYDNKFSLFLFCFILFYFILFYFILFYFCLFVINIFSCQKREDYYRDDAPMILFLERSNRVD